MVDAASVTDLFDLLETALTSAGVNVLPPEGRRPTLPYARFDHAGWEHSNRGDFLRVEVVVVHPYDATRSLARQVALKEIPVITALRNDARVRFYDTSNVALEQIGQDTFLVTKFKVRRP